MTNIRPVWERAISYEINLLIFITGNYYFLNSWNWSRAIINYIWKMSESYLYKRSYKRLPFSLANRVNCSYMYLHLASRSYFPSSLIRLLYHFFTSVLSWAFVEKSGMLFQWFLLVIATMMCSFSSWVHMGDAYIALRRLRTVRVSWRAKKNTCSKRLRISYSLLELSTAVF